MIIRRDKGFPDQKALHIPEAVIRRHQDHPLLSNILPVYTGIFPKALGHVLRREAIPEWILIYCADGQGWYEVGDTHWKVNNGDLLICDKDQAHAYGSSDDDPWTIHWAHFVGNNVPAFLSLIGITSDTSVVHIGNRLRIIQLFNEIHRTFEAGYSLPHLIHATACFREILSTAGLARMYSKPELTGDLNVEEIIAFMRKSITAFLKLEEIADHAHMSPSHFSRLFRAKTGTAPIEYFHRLKMQRACELLDTTEKSIAAVGRSLGYEDPYYFSRIFKRIIGRSPRTYRNLRRNIT